MREIIETLTERPGGKITGSTRFTAISEKRKRSLSMKKEESVKKTRHSRKRKNPHPPHEENRVSGKRESEEAPYGGRGERVSEIGKRSGKRYQQKDTDNAT